MLIITPHGGGDIVATASSVQTIAEEHGFPIRHLIIVNNEGHCPEEINNVESKNFKRGIIDITPIASRATARNHALAMLDSYPSQGVMFLDSGDLLVDEGIIWYFKNFPNQSTLNKRLIAFSSLINSESGRKAYRKNLSAKWIWLVNPFFLGSVILDSDIAKLKSFHEGRREDWKYWAEVAPYTQSITYTPKTLYVYNIRNHQNHLIRKSRLIKEQYVFFRSFFKRSMPSALLLTFMYYSLMGIRWPILFLKAKL